MLCKSFNFTNPYVLTCFDAYRLCAVFCDRVRPLYFRRGAAGAESRGVR